MSSDCLQMKAESSSSDVACARDEGIGTRNASGARAAAEKRGKKTSQQVNWLIRARQAGAAEANC